MRGGELARLILGNVDLDSAYLTVKQQVVPVDNQLVEADLKANVSRRTIDLDERTVAVLCGYRRSQLA